MLKTSTKMLKEPDLFISESSSDYQTLLCTLRE